VFDCRFMPCLKFIVQNAINKELRLLRGKTIECISLIGLAVSREKVSDVLITDQLIYYLLMPGDVNVATRCKTKARHTKEWTWALRPRPKILALKKRTKPNITGWSANL